MSDPRPGSSRREFLSGRAVRGELARAGDALAERLVAGEPPPRVAPGGGDSIRLETRAMACDFAVLLDPGPAERVPVASEALDAIHALELAMTVHRADGELFRLNARAADGPVVASAELFDVLRQARDLARATDGAFDPTAGPLNGLWRRCRREGRIPTEAEIAEHLELVGVERVRFDESERTIAFERLGMQFDLGAIGKGYALDRAAERLRSGGLDDWLVHGGRSTLLAHGDHAGLGGWPVGVRDPLFPERRLATVLLRDAAWSTSGNANQTFRHQGQRYGHLLDPRTGRPAEALLAASAFAPTAAEADALSTAFFVAGVEKTRSLCDNRSEIGAVLIPPPTRGRRLEPIAIGLPDDAIFWNQDDGRA